MCDENEIAKKIGSYLRKVRESKNIKLRKFASNIDYSHGHVSSIENGKKGLPKSQFLEKYLDELSDSYKEYNFYVNKISKLSEDKIKLPFIEYVDIDKARKSLSKGYLTESEKKFINDLDTISAPYEYRYMEDDEHEMIILSQPINDLNYHLNDKNNRKFYKKVELDEIDRKNVEILMDSYFKSKINLQKQFKNQLIHEAINIEDLNELIEKSSKNIN
ncbi:helix-turn-helix transcriptional regulator [Staphylococcus chromogenes]|uniref:helix-turn-helix domain-containing protein n=1 Tax=Staphylococcus chromogenes TaxID=46126 RepID=UPI001E5EA1E4|nr:helix-turn-helix transcriptional regulator [Staphylococcus chromogenes]MCD8904327.1 helix-turn-helix transcriptional regulator [Staphylococcus chromogenes]